MAKYRYVLFYRLEGEPEHTAHTELVATARDAKAVVSKLPTIVWASLCNDQHEEFRNLSTLK